MNRISVSELSDGQSVEQVFRAADKQLRVNRQGGKYILLKLSDKTGVIAGMLWNADERIFESFDRGDYVFCRGRTQIHNGTLQLIVTEVERMDESEVTVADFERFDANESERLMTRLADLIGGLENQSLRRLGEIYLADTTFAERFKKAAAAVSNHHAFPGGLLRHTVDMMEICKLVAPRYPQLDADLLLFGAFLHDLGKIEELSCDGEISYTDRGQLVGHIVIGVQMLGEKIAAFENAGDDFPAELRLHLEHMIVSHHGLIEFGSPKLPVMLESVTLHHIDNLDAKLWAYTAAIQTDVGGDEKWTNYNPSIGRKLWKK
ncbi:3'-5' exoribonuclease YhaM family protein [Rubripirellula tenax]|uniref:3'-5' exoribonuclease YhaM family protein n=1 Tax=Rubripirellula tenax TaxID=2528015 RepID=UPI0016496B96|nr:OB-fold nucleic acid binding domain-containing protein [Rubripirellula tenax]